MTCPKCGESVKVVDNVNTPDGSIYRRRKCTSCEHIFFTVERVIENDEQLQQIWSQNYRKGVRDPEKAREWREARKQDEAYMERVRERNRVNARESYRRKSQDDDYVNHRREYARQYREKRKQEKEKMNDKD